VGLGDNIEYRDFTNMSGPMRRGYQPGDTLVAGWVGALDIESRWTLSVIALAEHVYDLHNRPERPDGQICPSMGVGDVVIFGEIAVTVESEGVAICNVDHSDVVSDMSYRQYLSNGPARQ
jgi:hypothetical protein